MIFSMWNHLPWKSRLTIGTQHSLGERKLSHGRLLPCGNISLIETNSYMNLTSVWMYIFDHSVGIPMAEFAINTFLNSWRLTLGALCLSYNMSGMQFCFGGCFTSPRLFVSFLYPPVLFMNGPVFRLKPKRRLNCQYHVRNAIHLSRRLPASCMLSDRVFKRFECKK